MNSRLWLAIAGIVGATGVAMGAFQSHSLEKMLLGQELPAEEISRRLDLCSTAVRFQLIHAITLFAVAIVTHLRPSDRIWRVAGIAFCCGLLFFCGSLYAITFTGDSGYGKIAPIGGISFIAAWITVAVAAFWFAPIGPDSNSQHRTSQV